MSSIAGQNSKRVGKRNSGMEVKSQSVRKSIDLGRLNVSKEKSEKSSSSPLVPETETVLKVGNMVLKTNLVVNIQAIGPTIEQTFKKSQGSVWVHATKKGTWGFKQVSDNESIPMQSYFRTVVQSPRSVGDRMVTFVSFQNIHTGLFLARSKDGKKDVLESSKVSKINEGIQVDDPAWRMYRSQGKMMQPIFFYLKEDVLHAGLHGPAIEFNIIVVEPEVVNIRLEMAKKGGKFRKKKPKYLDAISEGSRAGLKNDKDKGRRASSVPVTSLGESADFGGPDKDRPQDKIESAMTAWLGAEGTAAGGSPSKFKKQEREFSALSTEAEKPWMELRKKAKDDPPTDTETLLVMLKSTLHLLGLSDQDVARHYKAIKFVVDKKVAPQEVEIEKEKQRLETGLAGIKRELIGPYLEERRRHHAAISIQSLVRGYLTRKRTYDMMHALESGERDSSAPITVTLSSARAGGQAKARPSNSVGSLESSSPLSSSGDAVSRVWGNLCLEWVREFRRSGDAFIDATKVFVSDRVEPLQTVATFEESKNSDDMWIDLLTVDALFSAWMQFASAQNQWQKTLIEVQDKEWPNVSGIFKMLPSYADRISVALLQLANQSQAIFETFESLRSFEEFIPFAKPLKYESKRLRNLSMDTCGWKPELDASMESTVTRKFLDRSPQVLKRIKSASGGDVKKDLALPVEGKKSEGKRSPRKKGKDVASPRNKHGSVDSPRGKKRSEEKRIESPRGKKADSGDEIAQDSSPTTYVKSGLSLNKESVSRKLSENEEEEKEDETGTEEEDDDEDAQEAAEHRQQIAQLKSMFEKLDGQNRDRDVTPRSSLGVSRPVNTARANEFGNTMSLWSKRAEEKGAGGVLIGSTPRSEGQTQAGDCPKYLPGFGAFVGLCRRCKAPMTAHGAKQAPDTVPPEEEPATVKITEEEDEEEKEVDDAAEEVSEDNKGILVGRSGRANALHLRRSCIDLNVAAEFSHHNFGLGPTSEEGQASKTPTPAAISTQPVLQKYARGNTGDVDAIAVLKYYQHYRDLSKSFRWFVTLPFEHLDFIRGHVQELKRLLDQLPSELRSGGARNVDQAVKSALLSLQKLHVDFNVAIHESRLASTEARLEQITNFRLPDFDEICGDGPLRMLMVEGNVVMLKERHLIERHLLMFTDIIILLRRNAKDFTKWELHPEFGGIIYFGLVLESTRQESKEEGSRFSLKFVDIFGRREKPVTIEFIARSPGETKLWCERFTERMEANHVLFGKKLSEVVAEEGRDVPFIVAVCVEELLKRGTQSEGIFRLTGNKKRMQFLRILFDKGVHRYVNPAMLSGEDVHTLACLLKQYLRDLPEPLFPYEVYDKLMVANGNVKRKVLFRLLPACNYQILKAIMSVIREVALHEQETRMGSYNLAVVFSPTLLRPANATEETPESIKTMTTITQSMIEYFISHPEGLSESSESNESG